MKKSVKKIIEIQIKLSSSSTAVSHFTTSPSALLHKNPAMRNVRGREKIIILSVRYWLDYISYACAYWVCALNYGHEIWMDTKTCSNGEYKETSYI